jgi:hypothetical protein
MNFSEEGLSWHLFVIICFPRLVTRAFLKATIPLHDATEAQNINDSLKSKSKFGVYSALSLLKQIRLLDAVHSKQGDLLKAGRWL